jgi:hypothetical protein
MGASNGREISYSMQKGHYSRETIYIRDDSSSYVKSSRTAGINWKVCNRRETSNMQQGTPDARCQIYQKQYGSQKL